MTRWVIAILSFLYFLQGMPYGIQIKFLPILLRKQGVSLVNISLFKLLFLPWVFKLLWAPLVDRYGTKKQWLIGTTILLSLACGLTAAVDFTNISQLALMLAVQNVCVSVQDISVDALAVCVLSAQDVGLGNVAQVAGYKVGGVIAGVVYMTMQNSVGHSATYIVLGLVYILALLIIHIIDFNTLESMQLSNEHSKQNSKTEVQTQETVNKKNLYFSIISEALSVRGTIWMITYTCLYKCGENASIYLIPMLLIDKGESDTKVAFCTGVLGSLTTILGSICGGFILKRYTSHESSYLLNISRCATLACIALLVNLWLVVSPEQSRFNYADTLILCCCIQLYLSGISSILTFSWMMHLSQNAPTHVQSTHYTLLATTEILGKLIFSSFIGYLQESTNYVVTFYALLVAVTVITVMTCNTPRFLRTVGNSSGEDNK